MSIRKVERTAEKFLCPLRIALILQKISFRKASIQVLQKIVEAKPVAEPSDEVDCALARSREIKNRQPRALFEQGAELVEPVALAGLQLGLALGVAGSGSDWAAGRRSAGASRGLGLRRGRRRSGLARRLRPHDVDIAFEERAVFDHDAR